MPEIPIQYELVECEFRFCLGLIPNVCPDAPRTILPADYYACLVDIAKPIRIKRIGSAMATIITDKRVGLVVKKETSNPDVEVLQSHVAREFVKDLSLSRSLSSVAKKTRKQPDVTAEVIRSFMDAFEKKNHGKRGAMKAAQLEFGFKDVRTLKKRLEGERT